MIKGPYFACALLLLMPALSAGADFRLQPRLDTGIMYYEYSQEAFQGSPTLGGLFANTASSLQYADTMMFVSGGFTLFSDRWFVDTGVRLAFDGNDSDNLRNQNFLAAGGFISTPTVFTTETAQEADFDRLEWAASIGYGLTEHIAVYAGYLKADTEFDTDLNGTINVSQASDLQTIPGLSGTFTSELTQQLKYDGPFIGVNLSLPVERGIFNGVLSGNVAIAFLEGTVDLSFKDFLISNELGQEVPFNLQSTGNTQGRGSFSDLDGDTVGLSLGISWRGATPIEGLTYSAGVNGFRYEFDSSDTPDFSEVQLRVNFGVAYAFDF